MNIQSHNNKILLKIESMATHNERLINIPCKPQKKLGIIFNTLHSNKYYIIRSDCQCDD